MRSIKGLSGRFIPAGAGNTSFANCRRAIIAVYPRWRGEHSSNDTGSALSAGLSPLARGTLDKLEKSLFVRRFIPAGAGNTNAVYEDGFWCAVYPRWRGEHDLNADIDNEGKGLSPLARGTLWQFAINTGLRRFIPAGAGNTLLPPLPLTPGPVYPRWRGEHCRQLPTIKPPSGLSPLARGTRIGAAEVATTTRFIPAGAGNTCRSWSTVRSTTVYPRWRGEHPGSLIKNRQSPGLSPLARGTY